MRSWSLEPKIPSTSPCRGPIKALVVLSISLVAHTAAPPGSWDNFNYAPKTRIVNPSRILSYEGSVEGVPDDLVYKANSTALTFASANSSVVFDFGLEVGGVVSFTVDNKSSGSIALTFSESSLYISSQNSDDSCTYKNPPVEPPQQHDLPDSGGTITQTLGQQRAGFRYMTMLSSADIPVTVNNIFLNLTFMPHWEDLRAYTGYFSAQDPVSEDEDFLTKLWYAGAYTVQTNTIDANQARVITENGGCSMDANGGPVAGPILVDGAKRDRVVWPGDMGISSHTQLVSTNDLESTKNSLLVMFSTSDPATGALNFSGPPINAHGSDTYISWTLIGAHDYYQFSGDLSFVSTVWDNFTYALEFLQSHVDDTGLMYVPPAFQNDWGRFGGGGHASTANALLYRNLVTAAELAKELNDSMLATAYRANASVVKDAYNALLWDSESGMYRDNDTTALHPQDGNSLAVIFNLTANASQTSSISDGLTTFWTPFGAVTPELADNISPFVSGFELEAHFIAGRGVRALELMRSEWGYMLTTNISVQSTLLEGFTSNGSLGYRAEAGYAYDHTYTSHAHGWSTGPSSILTFYVVGIRLTSPEGSTWAVAPNPSGLSSAEGGFETNLGWFGVSWEIVGEGGFSLELATPDGTSGIVVLPFDPDEEVSVSLDEQEVEVVFAENRRQIAVEGGVHKVAVIMASGMS